MTDLAERPLTDVGRAAAALPVQFLSADGELVAGAGGDGVDPTKVLDFYRDMFLARRFDQEAYNLQRQGELGLWLSCQGQEAAQVGSIRAVRDSDYVFPAYREHAAALCRGLSPSEMLAQWRGTAHGGWDPAAHRFHINSLVLSTQLLHATGYALGVSADRRRDASVDEVVLCYFGDGSASQGDANEALNWAAVTDAPMVFFCQNNQWAISTPSAAQSKTPLHVRAAGFGLPSTLVDGNDVLAVHAATSAAVQRVRDGGAPEFIEAVTYRMAGHSTSDDPSRYRDSCDVEFWNARDPLVRVRRLLDHSGWGTAEFFRSVDEEADELAAATRSACHSLENPLLESTFQHTLVHETASVEQERERYTAWRNSFA
ncbi:thiamine pyrophosphate-dependent enzyme [Gordonia terrae]